MQPQAYEIVGQEAPSLQKKCIGVSRLCYLHKTVTNSASMFIVYNKALKALQFRIQKETESGNFSDDLLVALSCLTAVASFSGNFSIAAMHRDASIRILELRGKGDVLNGLQGTHPWIIKAIQW
jgi:hypothetical protein